MYPTFNYEQRLWQKGLRFVGGADEVGRGAFAGPVVTAVVVFDPLNTLWPKEIVVRDSKKMTAKQRLLATSWIKENTYWGIGETSVAAINKNGIGKATHTAFRKAVKEAHYHLPKRLDHLLLDAFLVPYLRGVSRRAQTAIIKGDELSASIAAASIIAKVYRDDLMVRLGNADSHRKYKWHRNAGYGTAEHREAIGVHGACRHHRSDYVKSLLAFSPGKLSA